MDLTAIDLLALQTSYMKEDPTTQAYCAAITPWLQKAADSIVKVLILSRVDELDEDVLDALAYDLHIEWYDATADISVKHSLIKNSDKVHMYLGTPFAVEQVVQDYFGDGEVEEWFDYSGSTYHFRVLTSNSAVTGDQAELFAKAIEKVKNKRSVLDSVIVNISADMNMYLGHVVHVGDTVIIEQVV